MTLRRRALARGFVATRRPHTVREVLSVEEAARLLEAAPGIKYKAALGVAYGAGLRVSAVAHLKVDDIDSQRMLIRVEQGKGGRDRDAMLSPQLLELLRLRAREVGLTACPMPAGHEDDVALERRPFRQMERPPRDMTEPDCQLVSREMKRKGVTLLLLWQEYREAHPGGFGYTWFCDKFGQHAERANRPTGTAMPPAR